MLIVLEGALDGIGKTTQYNLLKQFLSENNIKFKCHHFPSYDTFQGKIVENYLNGTYGRIEELSPYFINSLYAVDRAITWNMELKKSYENKEVILLDRYTTSSLIYQSTLIEDIEEKKKFIDYVCDFEFNKLNIPKPDCVIFLTAPFDLISKMRLCRKQNAGILNDIHEKDLEFMKKVYDNSLFVADYLNWIKIESSKNNEMKSIDEIHKEIVLKLKKFFNIYLI